MFQKIMLVLCLCVPLLIQGYAQGNNLFISLPQKQAIEEKRPIVFFGRTYYFGFGDITKNEYFTRKEGLKGWSSMIGVYNFPNMTDPYNTSQFLLNNFLAKGLTAKSNQNTKNPVLTFMIENQSNLEFNIWRFYQNTDQNAVIGLRFAKAFKKPVTETQKQTLKKEIQELSDQFLNLPRQPFIW